MGVLRDGVLCAAAWSGCHDDFNASRVEQRDANLFEDRIAIKLLCGFVDERVEQHSSWLRLITVALKDACTDHALRTLIREQRPILHIHLARVNDDIVAACVDVARVVLASKS